MTITELAKIIVETINETEDDIQHYAELAQKTVSITIQVMEALKGVTLDMQTRDLKHALLVQKIIEKANKTSQFNRNTAILKNIAPMTLHYRNCTALNLNPTAALIPAKAVQLAPFPGYSSNLPE